MMQRLLFLCVLVSHHYIYTMKASLNTLGIDGLAPLHHAVLTGKATDIVQLCNQGAHIGFLTQDGQTVFHLAATQNATTQNTLLGCALLAQSPALLDALRSPIPRTKAFALSILQERAIALKHILAHKRPDRKTSDLLELEGKPHGSRPLLCAARVYKDLQAFIDAVERQAIATLEEPNVFKAAYTALKARE